MQTTDVRCESVQKLLCCFTLFNHTAQNWYLHGSSDTITTTYDGPSHMRKKNASHLPLHTTLSICVRALLLDPHFLTLNYYSLRRCHLDQGYGLIAFSYHSNSSHWICHQFQDFISQSCLSLSLTLNAAISTSNQLPAIVLSTWWHSSNGPRPVSLVVKIPNTKQWMTAERRRVGRIQPALGPCLGGFLSGQSIIAMLQQRPMSNTREVAESRWGCWYRTYSFCWATMHRSGLWRWSWRRSYNEWRWQAGACCCVDRKERWRKALYLLDRRG